MVRRAAARPVTRYVDVSADQMLRWLDRREEGGFTREVVSHFLFLTRRLLGPLGLLESTVSFPEEGRSFFVNGRVRF